MSVLGLVGCGLLGGSFALAAKSHRTFSTVLGRDLNESVLQEARKLGVIDDVWTNGAAVDAVCVAVPVQTIPTIVEHMARELDQDIPFFDVGSVKSSVLNRLDEIPSNFVPCHPIAGSHASGPSAAYASLFEDSVCVITPTPTTNARSIEFVQECWHEVGARTIIMTPDLHDEAVALTSHLPHLVSSAVVGMLMQNEPESGSLTGSGFRDFSRIAAGDARMWRDIFVENLKHLRLSFQSLTEATQELLELAETDPDGLEQRLRLIAGFRDELHDK